MSLKISIAAFLILALSLIANPPEVKIAGEMKNIMQKGDFRAYADLDTIIKKHLYALGPVENLNGEIMVLDGTVYSSTKKEGNITNSSNASTKAAMLVYSYVPEWTSIKAVANISDYDQLEKLIEKKAAENGFDLSVPFAFMIEVSPRVANYHVIDWKPGVVHTMENHRQFAYNSKFADQKVTLLGFYSDHHHSVFTHHTTNMHLHVLDEKTKTVGHLDNIQIDGEFKIYLPVKKQ